MRLLEGILNILLWAFFICTSLVLFVGACVVWLLTFFWDTNRKILQQYSCFWSSIYIWANPFWSVQTSGKENVHPHQVYVMVSNHKSLMDILVLFRSFLHFKWVSKASMFKAPLLGWNMKLNGYIPINRGDPQSREKCMAHCKEWLKKGSSVLFFPEGTRSKDGTMGKFKLGAFRLALETGTDVLPILIVGSEKAVPKHSAKLTTKAKMKIQLLPPISVRDYDLHRITEESARLAEVVYQTLQGALKAQEIAA
jgi:1-acyl-sn-glycerol-3-phosphate acyltransferase